MGLYLATIKEFDSFPGHQHDAIHTHIGVVDAEHQEEVYQALARFNENDYSIEVKQFYPPNLTTFVKQVEGLFHD